MKIPTVITALIPKKKKKTHLQRLMRAVAPQKKQLTLLRKQLLKKWRKSPLRKTLKAKGKKAMLACKKRPVKKYIPNLLLQRMP